jgi:hypothetical protein
MSQRRESEGAALRSGSSMSVEEKNIRHSMSNYDAAPHPPKSVPSTAVVSPANQMFPVMFVLCGMCASTGSRRLSMSRFIMMDDMLAG